jgi:hypothetical protein
MAYRSPFDDPQVREEFRIRLNQIEGIALDPDAVEKRPSISISLLRESQQRQRFYDAIEWFLETARQGAPAGA